MDEQEKKEDQMRRIFEYLRSKDSTIKGMSHLNEFKVTGNLTLQGVYIASREVPDPDHPNDSFLAYTVYNIKVRNDGTIEEEKILETDPQTSQIILDEEYSKKPVVGAMLKHELKPDENGVTDRTLMGINRTYLNKDGEEVTEMQYATSSYLDRDQIVSENGDIDQNEYMKHLKSYAYSKTSDVDQEQDKKDLTEEEMKEKKEAETGKKVVSIMYIESPIFYAIASSTGRGSYKCAVVEYEGQEGSYEIVNSYGETIGKSLGEKGTSVGVLTSDGQDERPICEAIQINSYICYVTRNERDMPELSFNEYSNRGELSYSLRTNNDAIDEKENEIARDAMTYEATQVNEDFVKERVEELDAKNEIDSSNISEEKIKEIAAGSKDATVVDDEIKEANRTPEEDEHARPTDRGERRRLTPAELAELNKK